MGVGSAALVAVVAVLVGSGRVDAFVAAGVSVGEGALAVVAAAVVEVAAGCPCDGAAEGAGVAAEEVDEGAGAPDGKAFFESTPLPCSSSMRLGRAVLPAKKSSPDKAGTDEGAGGKMSDWKASALRGQMKEIGWMRLLVNLYALAISLSSALRSLRGRKVIPRCGSVDLYSVR